MHTYLIYHRFAFCPDIFITVQPNQESAILHYFQKSGTQLTVKNFTKNCKVKKLEKHGDFEYFEL